jgi:hypothetical protein
MVTIGESPICVAAGWLCVNTIDKIAPATSDGSLDGLLSALLSGLLGGSSAGLLGGSFDGTFDGSFDVSDEASCGASGGGPALVRDMAGYEPSATELGVAFSPAIADVCCVDEIDNTAPAPSDGSDAGSSLVFDTKGCDVSPAALAAVVSTPGKLLPGS